MGKNYMRDVCLPLWNSPRVNWDGKIMGCCWNSWGDFGGNAFHDGLVSAINNEKITLAREMLLGKRGPIDGIPCTTCDMYMKIKESRRFFTALEVNCHSLRRFVSTFQANRDSRWYGVARFLYHNFFAWKSWNITFTIFLTTLRIYQSNIEDVKFLVEMCGTLFSSSLVNLSHAAWSVASACIASMFASTCGMSL